MIKKVSKKFLSFLLLLVTLFVLSGCSEDKYKSISGLNTEENVSIKIGIANKTDTALNSSVNDFMKMYPNVNISLEYVQDYSKNAEGLFKNGDIDVILMRDVKYSETSADKSPTGVKMSTEDYYYDFSKDTEINFSYANSLINNNYAHTRIGENNESIKYQYCIPLGGETRGLFVNKSFLKYLNLNVPTNYEEFLDCCQAIKDKGYVPIQGNPSIAALALDIPEAARTLVNDPENYEKLRNAELGLGDIVKSTIQKFLTINEKFYYDYKTIEKTGKFTVTTGNGQLMSFLDLKLQDDMTIMKPENNIGETAFFPYPSSYMQQINDLIKEYDLDTEVEFILTPFNEKGTNAAAYITIYEGLCINKNSKNLIWLREFVNFMMYKDNAIKYAEEAGIIPNTSDNVKLLMDKYNISQSDVIICGSIMFSDEYNAFKPIGNGLVDVCKANCEKYMVKIDKDANGNIIYQLDDEGKEYLPLADDKAGTDKETKIYKEYIGKECVDKKGYAICNLDYYIKKFDDRFKSYR